MKRIVFILCALFTLTPGFSQSYTGRFLGSWNYTDSSRAEIAPITTAILGDDTLAIPIPLDGEVKFFSLDGKSLRRIMTNGASGVAAWGKNHVVCVEHRAARIKIFTVLGALKKEWGAPGSRPGEFKMPSGVAVDKEGRIYVADKGNNRIQKFNSNGDFLLEFGGKVLETPLQIASLPNGNLLVLCLSGAALLSEFSRDGQFVANWLTEERSPLLGSSLVTLPTGEAVVGTLDSYIAVVNRTKILGKFRCIAKSTEDALPVPSQINGLAVTPGLRLFASDLKNGRVLTFQLERK
ncbi:MAG TPA: hypothetical protein VHO24_21045 [Opitutaceae bacterium]|nr:hypothetical protein [Opitutaceae bacterium]